MAIKKTNLILLIVVVLALVIPGCGKSQQEKDYETLQTEMASLQQEYQASQTEVGKLQGELTSKSSALSEAQSSNDALKRRVSELESQLRITLDTEIPQYYGFAFQARNYSWTLPIPLRTYLYYKDITRPAGTSKYSDMASDNFGDSVINVLVGKIRETALDYNLKQTDIINLVATFTQSLVNTNKNVLAPYDDYSRYPIETLFQQGGDSEDNSILVAVLLKKLGFNVVFLVFEQPRHVAVGIDIPGGSGFSWEYQAVKYYYLETTGERMQLGDSPNAYTTAQPLVFPLGK